MVLVLEHSPLWYFLESERPIINNQGWYKQVAGVRIGSIQLGTLLLGKVQRLIWYVRPMGMAHRYDVARSIEGRIIDGYTFLEGVVKHVVLQVV